jgi:phosphoribosylamine---glycine ligase
VVSPSVHAKVLREIIRPTVEGMASDGIPYTGFLYAGLMIDAKGDVKTVEFNCRLGDPETQPIMARLKSDFATALELAIDGNLDKVELEWDRRTALGVVMASANYPGEPKIGDVIHGLPERGNVVGSDVLVFHSGTKLEGDKVVTSGGRVLCVTGMGDSVKMAQDVAYEAINKIRFAGMQFRRDIGHRALPNRLRKGK